MNKIDSKKVKFPLSSISLAWKFIWQNDENEEISMIFFMKKKKKKSSEIFQYFLFFLPLNITKTFFILALDGPAVVSVNIFVRSISKIDDVVMVSE